MMALESDLRRGLAIQGPCACRCPGRVRPRNQVRIKATLLKVTMGPHVLDVGPIGAGQAVSGNRTPVLAWQRYPNGFLARYCWWWSSA